MLKTTLGLLILALALTGTAAEEGDYYRGLAAYNRGDYAEALAEWTLLAGQGDVEAQYRIGRMYSHGEGERDDAQAAAWYRRAANRGHARAANNLGLLYDKGRGVDRDLSEAAGWYRVAADLGLATGQYNLARAYDLGTIHLSHLLFPPLIEIRKM